MKAVIVLTAMIFLIGFVSATGSFGYGGIEDSSLTVNTNTYVGNLTNLSQMQDVNTPAPTDNQLLAWDTATSTWIAQTFTDINKWIIDITNGYFYNSTDTLYFNDTLLNNTIDNRAIITESDPIWIADKTNYSTTLEIIALGYYNSSDFNISDYYTSTKINGFGFYNSSDFNISDYYLNSNPSNYWNDIHATFNKTYADTLYAILDYGDDWNKTYADTLYAVLNYGDDWNKTYADTLYADISIVSDNSSWNETYADTIYAPVNYGDDWNKTYADTLYYDISNPSGFYNSSNFSIGDYYLNSNPLGYWNNTYATFNKTYADTLYADISIVSDNSSWNETYADTIYAPVNYGDDWNKTYADTLYYDISNPSGFYNSSNFSIGDYLTSAEILAFNYYNSSDFNISNYYNSSQTDTAIETANTSVIDWIDEFFPRISELASLLGNWSADKISYSTTEEADTYYYGITNPSEFWNDTHATFNKTYADTLYAVLNYGDDWNKTYADTLYYDISNPSGFYNSSDFDISDYYLNSNPLGYWNNTYATFNKTYADGLYADISIVTDNSSWNETYADTIYSPIGEPLSLHLTQDNWYNDSNGYLNWDGDSIEFNRTKLEVTYYNASALEVVTGTGAGVLSDIQTYNIISYNVTEDSSDYELRVNFTGIIEFTTLLVRHKTDTMNGHTAAIQIWDYSDSEWEDYGILTESIIYEMKTLGVYDEAEHIGTGANAGVVQVRFYQDESPGKAHMHQFDWVSLSKGFGTPVGQEIDPIWSAARDNYYNKTDIDEFNYWNDTYATFNKTYADGLYAAIGTEDNSSWNQSLADTLYAPVNYGDDWNETYADTLYYGIGNPSGFYNSSDFSISDYYTSAEIEGFNYYNSSNFDISDYYLNSNPSKFWNDTSATFNKTYADTLYAIINYGDDWNKTYADTLYAILGYGDNWNKTYADTLYADITEPIAVSLGNWSADKDNYATTDYADSLGNFSAWDKDYGDLINVPTFTNDTWVDTYFVRFTELVTQVGNWSLDKSDYSTTTAANLLYAPINYGDDWNKTYADTLYSVINYGDDWNKTYADTLYAILGYGDDWNKTYADSLYYDINNPSGYYNSSDFDIANYYTSADSATFTALTLTSPLAVPQGGTGQQTFTDGCVVFGSGVNPLTCSAALTAGTIIIGDGAGDPQAVTMFTAAQGYLKDEFGGLEADLRDYTNGLYGISSGATIEVNTSALMAGAISDETGNGLMVFGTSPTLITPTLGVADATTLNTGNGDYELYNMDQNLTTTDNVDFNNVTVEDCIIFKSGGRICDES